MKRLLYAFAAAALVAGCTSDEVSVGPTPTGNEYDVLSTAYPLFEITGRLGGDRFKASNLRPEGALSSTPLTEEEKQRIADAGVLFMLGGGAQPEIAAIAASRSNPTVVVEPVDGERFPWLSPVLMGDLIETVRTALIAFDPEGAKLFNRNAKRYGATIAALDKTFSRELAHCQRDEIITTYSAFGPLARRYGLTQVTAGNDDEIREAVRTHDAEVVFFAELPSLNEAKDRLASGGYRSAVLSPIVDQTDHARRGGANYRVLMGLNLDAISHALGCTEDSERK